MCVVPGERRGSPADTVRFALRAALAGCVLGGITGGALVGGVDDGDTRRSGVMLPGSNESRSRRRVLIPSPPGPWTRAAGGGRAPGPPPSPARVPRDAAVELPVTPAPAWTLADTRWVSSAAHADRVLRGRQGGQQTERARWVLHGAYDAGLFGAFRLLDHPGLFER